MVSPSARGLPNGVLEDGFHAGVAPARGVPTGVLDDGFHAGVAPS